MGRKGKEGGERARVRSWMKLALSPLVDLGFLFSLENKQRREERERLTLAEE